MTIVFACSLAVAAFCYILFVRKQDIPDPLPVSPIEHLDERKQAIYENLRDLQFEFRLGKLSDEDYASTKQALQRELAVVLAETEDVVKRLGMKVSPTAPAKKSKTVCPQCGASFADALRFCGECGKAIS